MWLPLVWIYPFRLSRLSSDFYLWYFGLGHVLASRLHFLVSTGILGHLNPHDIYDWSDYKLAKFQLYLFRALFRHLLPPLILCILMRGVLPMCILRVVPDTCFWRDHSSNLMHRHTSTKWCYRKETPSSCWDRSLIPIIRRSSQYFLGGGYPYHCLCHK